MKKKLKMKLKIDKNAHSDKSTFLNAKFRYYF